MEEVMKYALIATVALATLAATPALAGGRGHGAGLNAGGLVGSILAPVTTTVSALNVTAMNGIGVLNGAAILSGNSVNVLNGNRTSVKGNNVGLNAPIVLKGLLGGGSHGCGCF
jgi:hypothetical protein